MLTTFEQRNIITKHTVKDSENIGILELLEESKVIVATHPAENNKHPASYQNMHGNDSESNIQAKIYLCAVIATYWVVSISLVYLNKCLMSNDVISIPAPLFITWFQCAMTSILCWFAGLFGDRNVRSQGFYQRLNGAELGEQPLLPKHNLFSQFPKVTYSTQIAVQIFPLSLIFVGMIAFNNICLKYVEVSYYNVARSLTIIFSVTLSWLLLGVPTNKKTAACLCIVVAGFFIGTKGELNFSLIGTGCGIASSLFVSLNSIVTKRILPIVDDNHWRLTLYNNINACMILAPLVYVFEADFIMEHVKLFRSPMYWSAMILAGFLGFAIGIVTVLQIKATSPLTHNFSGTAKAGVQSMLAFYIWGNEATPEGVVGIFIVLCGSLVYTFVRMNQNTQAIQLVKPNTNEEMQNNSESSLTPTSR